MSQKHIPPTKGARNKPNPQNGDTQKESRSSRDWAAVQTYTNIFLTAFTLLLLFVAVKQCQNFRNSQRPWVGVGHVAPSLRKSDLAVGMVRITYNNGGQSPALNGRADFKLLLGAPLPLVPRDTVCPINPDCMDDNIPLPGTDGPLIVPGTGPASEASVLVPGDPEALANWQEIVSNTKGLYLSGCVDYDDEFGAHHRTHLSEVYYVPDKAFFSCGKGNGAD
jgi:hypothetical protein